MTPITSPSPVAWRYKATALPDDPWQASTRQPLSAYCVEPLYAYTQAEPAKMKLLTLDELWVCRDGALDFTGQYEDAIQRKFAAKNNLQIEGEE